MFLALPLAGPHSLLNRLLSGLLSAPNVFIFLAAAAQPGSRWYPQSPHQDGTIAASPACTPPGPPLPADSGSGYDCPTVAFRWPRFDAGGTDPQRNHPPHRADPHLRATADIGAREKARGAYWEQVCQGRNSRGSDYVATPRTGEVTGTPLPGMREIFLIFCFG